MLHIPEHLPLGPPLSCISLIFFFSSFFHVLFFFSYFKTAIGIRQTISVPPPLPSNFRFSSFTFLLLTDFFFLFPRLSVQFCNNEEQSNFSVFATGYCWVPPEGCNNIPTGGKEETHIRFLILCNWSTRWVCAIGSMPKSIRFL